jgi:hypothetical protein
VKNFSELLEMHLNGQGKSRQFLNPLSKFALNNSLLKSGSTVPATFDIAPVLKTGQAQSCWFLKPFCKFKSFLRFMAKNF